MASSHDLRGRMAAPTRAAVLFHGHGKFCQSGKNLPGAYSRRRGSEIACRKITASIALRAACRKPLLAGVGKRAGANSGPRHPRSGSWHALCNMRPEAQRNASRHSMPRKKEEIPCCQSISDLIPPRASTPLAPPRRAAVRCRLPRGRVRFTLCCAMPPLRKATAPANTAPARAKTP